MTFLNELMLHLTTIAAWVQTPDGTNMVAAAICLAALLGTTSRMCLVATLLLHLLLVVL